MTTLAQLQRHFQANVLHGDEKMLALVIGTQEVQTATRLSIYSEGYRLRLIDALASNVPRLQQLLGEQEFATLAQRYIDACPSSYRSIRWFGDQLAQSLEHWHAEEPWLAELARWEWTIAAAFDAGDAPILGEAAIGALAPEAWPELTLQFHPSMHCLRTRTNAPAQGARRRFGTAAARHARQPAVLADLAPGADDSVPIAEQERSGDAGFDAGRRHVRGDVHAAVRLARCAAGSDARRRHAQAVDRRWIADRHGQCRRRCFTRYFPLSTAAVWPNRILRLSSLVTCVVP
jgi:Putative DNA-binding domain